MGFFESIESKSDAIELMIPTGPWRIGQIDLTKDWLHFKMPSPQSLNGEPTL